MNKNLWIITDRQMTEKEAAKYIAETETWDIEKIENLPEQVAKLKAERHEIIKGHDVYFIDFEGYFGYSYVVYLRGHQLRYAGDYELHHSDKSREQLNKLYKRNLNAKLYTERGLGNKLKSYNDYRARNYYLHNYYCDLENHVSIYGNFNDSEVVAAYKDLTKGLTYNPVAFAYYSNEAFVGKCQELELAIESAKNALNEDCEYWKKAFRYEFANYECIYGGRYAEAAYAATNGKSLNDIQKRAFKEAKSEYERYCYDHDMP